MHKSTALRLLRTLHEHGLVYRQSDQRYRLGARLIALAQEAMENLDIREIAHPHLVRLNEQCGHTVHLAVYEESEVLYIDKVESRYPVRMYSRIGKPVAITVAAVAKLLLADLPEVERRAVADKLDYPMYTARSTPNAPAFLRELEKVRDQGWATDLGGHEESINCVGAPPAVPTAGWSPRCRSPRRTSSSPPTNSSPCSRWCAARPTRSAGSTRDERP